MPGVIYRKGDGQVVFPVAPDQPFRGIDVEIERNVLPNYHDGQIHDFAWLELSGEQFRHLTTLTNVVIRDGAVTGTPRVADPEPPTADSDLAAWAQSAQAELVAQRQILDLLLLGGLDDTGGTIDGEIGADLPDSGGTLDDLEGLDLGTLPDSGETLDDLDLAALEG